MKSLCTILILLTTVVLFSCRKEGLSSDPAFRLRFSEDSISFDTVFTRAGSATQVFKIVNDNDRNIPIQSIRLSNPNSSFHFNVNGIPGPSVNGITVRAKDSIYVFVTVTIDPNAASQPFLVKDSLEVSYNSNFLKIGLNAFGRNAHFLNNYTVRNNETWTNDLPYVIRGKLTVDSAAKLNITKGCQLYFHADAPFIVNGSLNISGEKFDSTRVLINGDRLDEPYKDYPASYPGLIFTASSHDNSLLYTTIRNAYQGILIVGSVKQPDLKLDEVIIDNAYESGLICSNSIVTANNLLVSNCTRNILLSNGGNYMFNHCTSAAYANNFIQHKYPALYATNTAVSNQSVRAFQADFTNCIFYGESNGFVKDEVVVQKDGSLPFSVRFRQVFWRVESMPANATISGVVAGSSPMFALVDNARRKYDFHLRDESPCINKGITTGLLVDLDGKPRSNGAPDLGCYEK